MYNKLVRDRIPEIISNDGKKFEYRVMNEHEFKKKLIEKFEEERIELINSNNSEEIKEELADILELVYAYSKFFKIDFKEIEDIRNSKLVKRGGYDNKILLKYVDD